MDWPNAFFSVVSFGQSAFQHGNDIRWNEVDFFLQVRQLHGDILNHCREDIQDIYDKDERIMDTNLVVATLMLGCGFGFAVEGTFPQGDEDCPECHVSQAFRRNCYAVVNAFSLVCPFLSMLGFMQCRHRLNLFMKYVNHHLHGMLVDSDGRLSSHISNADSMVHAARTTQGLPKLLPTPPRLCLCRRRAARHTRSSSVIRRVHEEALELKRNYFEWHQRWIQKWLRVSEVAMYLGVLFNVLCAALLLSMYFQSTYPQTPQAWHLYFGITLGGLAVAIAILLHGVSFRTRAVDDPSTPRWLREASARLLRGETGPF